jgi:glyoxylase I family protein
MTDASLNALRTTGIAHFSPTVSDVETSAAWYIRVFGLVRLPHVAPHHGDDDGGYAVLLTNPHTGLLIGLHHHESHIEGSFDERRSGLDHISWGVESRAQLDDWGNWLDELEVSHSGVIEKERYSAIVFRDPDNIQLELIHKP